MTASVLIVRTLPPTDYHTTWAAMQAFTNDRGDNTPDEVWLLEHFPVFTQGQNGKAEHVLNAGDIPIVQTDRGGQVTYHGPGQLMMYVLIDLRRKKLNVRELVTQLETMVIEFLADAGFEAVAKRDAPGVYINDNKICSIGLRIRKGCSYHGIAFNVDLNLEPFNRINPCGYAGLKMTSLANELATLPQDHQTASTPLETLSVGRQLVNYLAKNLGYTTTKFTELMYDRNN